MTGPITPAAEHVLRDLLGDPAPRRYAADTVKSLLAEIDQLREQRDHLVSAFDKLSDQMGELVQAAQGERGQYVAENQRLRAELADAAGYLAATHRHANRHDLLAADLGCAGCELLGRIEGEQ